MNVINSVNICGTLPTGFTSLLHQRGSSGRSSASAALLRRINHRVPVHYRTPGRTDPAAGMPIRRHGRPMVSKPSQYSTIHSDLMRIPFHLRGGHDGSLYFDHCYYYYYYHCCCFFVSFVLSVTWSQLVGWNLARRKDARKSTRRHANLYYVLPIHRIFLASIRAESLQVCRSKSTERNREEREREERGRREEGGGRRGGSARDGRVAGCYYSGMNQWFASSSCDIINDVTGMSCGSRDTPQPPCSLV